MTFRFTVIVAFVLFAAVCVAATEDHVLIEVCPDFGCTKNCTKYYTQQGSCWNFQGGNFMYSSFQVVCSDVPKCVVGHRFSDAECQQEASRLTYPCETCQGDKSLELLCNEESITGLMCEGTQCNTCTSVFNAPVNKSCVNASEHFGRFTSSVKLTAFRSCKMLATTVFPTNFDCSGSNFTKVVPSDSCAYTEGSFNPKKEYSFNFQCVSGVGATRLHKDALPIGTMPADMLQALEHHLKKN